MSFALARECRICPEDKYQRRLLYQRPSEDQKRSALRMWYGDKSRAGLGLDLSKEVVYSPTLTELIEACGVPFHLSCDAEGQWYAANSTKPEMRQSGETPAGAVARLWLVLHSTI
jgi:hypothetical protein